MKFQPDSAEGVNLITRHESSRIWVGSAQGNLEFGHSVLVPWVGAPVAWRPAAPQELTEDDFEAVLALAPELVVFGSGPRQQFVSARLYRRLIESRVGIETMDTAAACRTYNVLAGEGRRVLAALMVAPDGGR